MNKVYAFQYCDCIFEGSLVTMSLHKTYKSAYRALRKHLLEGYSSWREEGIRYGRQSNKFGILERRRVEILEVNE